MKNSLVTCQSPKIEMRLAGHIPELDGIRGLAILVVTFYRFSREMPVDSTIGAMLRNSLALGVKGVDLFFVLSGFLITGILVESRGKAGYFRNFFARRSLRIFPLYFLSLAFCVCLIPWWLGDRNPFQQATEQQIYLWTYLTNFRMSWLGQWSFGRLDHFWSLAVEEHFYLIWPIIIYAVPQRWLLRVAVVGCAASATSRIAFAAWSSNQVAPDVFSLFRFDALLLGSTLALAMRQSSAATWSTTKLWQVFFASLTLSLISSYMNRRFLTISYTLWPVSSALLIALVLRLDTEHRLVRVFRMPWLRMLGKYSYAMYVFQSPLIPIIGMLSIGQTAFSMLGGSDSIFAHLVYIVFMFVLTLGLAILSWNLIEKRFLELRKHFKS